MIGADGSAAQLADLDRRNLFVVALDSRRRWYRYHPLFAELLRSRLDAEEPGTAAELHGRAAAWLARDGQIAEAIGHAIAAGDQHATAELVAGHWLTFFNQGWLMTVGRWLDALPRRAARGRAAAVAGAGLDLDGPRRARRGRARGSRRAPEGDEWVGVLRALRLFKLGDVGGAARAAGAAVEAHAIRGLVLAHRRRRSSRASPRTGAGATTRRGRRCATRRASPPTEGNALARQYVLGYLALDAVEHDGPQAGARAAAPSPPDASSGSASTSPP